VFTTVFMLDAAGGGIVFLGARPNSPSNGSLLPLDAGVRRGCTGSQVVKGLWARSGFAGVPRQADSALLL